MAGSLRVGLDLSGPSAYYAAVEHRGGRDVLVAAGMLGPGERPPKALAGAETHVALRAQEALVIALPGVAIEEAEEAFRWEVAKSGAIAPDSPRHVFKRGPGVDSGPPFLGVAGDGLAADQRATAARDMGLSVVAVTIEATAVERLLYACGKLPARGTVIHADVREGTSIVSAYAAAGLALRRTIRTQPVEPQGLAIDIQRSASYGERKLSLPAAEAVYISGEGVTPDLVAEIARGLPGLVVEALDPFAAVEIGPKLDAAQIQALGPRLDAAIGLALFDHPVPDFLPPVERGARAVRKWRGRARIAALALAPVVLGCGFLVRGWLERAEAGLASARQRYGRVELLQKRSEELLASVGRGQAWREVLRQLGDGDHRVSRLLLAFLRELPDEAYLSEIDVRGHYLGDADVRGREGDIDVKVRGELVAPDETVLVNVRDSLRNKAAVAVAPGTQASFDVTKKAQGQVRVGFRVDGIAKETP